MEIKETEIVAVPSAADTWTNIVSHSVPAGVTKITKLKFVVSPDFGTSATSIRVAPVFRILGSGLKEQSPHAFLASFGGVYGVAGGTGMFQDEGQEYDVNIPVNPGATFDSQVNTLDEAITAGTCLIEITYSDEPYKEGNSMADYIDVAMTTTADAWVNVGTLRLPTAEGSKQPKRIREIAVGIAPDQGTSAISLRAALRVRLSGSGLKGSGRLELLGTGAGNETITDGAGCYDRMTVRQKVNIPINAGGDILVEHRLAVETPSAGTVAIGLLYE